MPRIPEQEPEQNGNVERAEARHGEGRRLALNIYDLTDRCDPIIQQKVGPLLDLKHPLRMDFDRKEGEDEVGVAFSCDLLKAATICDLLRSHDREAGDRPIRLYLFRKVWSRVPSGTVLTVLEDGKPRLDPRTFAEARVELEAAPVVAPPPRRFTFGKR